MWPVLLLKWSTLIVFQNTFKGCKILGKTIFLSVTSLHVILNVFNLVNKGRTVCRLENSMMELIINYMIMCNVNNII